MKIGIEGAFWTAEYYEATVVSVVDYYPFGSAMAGRKYNQGSYRYGFNGMEKDDEVKGEGNSYTTHHRLLDTRIGRWFSVDPKAKFMSWQSPYVFVDNSPNFKVDPGGDIPAVVIWMLKKAGEGAIGVATDIAVQLAVEKYLGGHDTWESAWDNLDINWSQALRSGGENLIGNKHVGAAVSAAGDMLEYMFTEENPTWEGAMYRGGLGVASAYLGSSLSSLAPTITKHLVEKGTDAFNGLKYLIGDRKAIAYVWEHMPAINHGKKGSSRGEIIENYLAGTKYRKYDHVGTKDNGYYGYIDFYKSGLGISLKTTKAATKKGQEQAIIAFKKNIDQMVQMKKSGKHPNDGIEINEVQLDIVTPNDKNYDSSWLKEVKDYGKKLGVKVNVDKL